jgi:truncated hemoglobin YjbI
MELPENFYKLVEQPGFLKSILYGDTDSIFISIPIQNADSLSVEKRWGIAENSAKEINDLIIEYVTGSLLPRCNIQSSQNKTFFKTELLIDAAMFLDVKKNYAYKLSCKEGKIIDPPKIRYTGIQVVKSDAAKLTQNLLKAMIEKVMLNENIKRIDRQKEIAQIVQSFHNDFVESVINYKFHDIGFPGKWAKKDMFIKGMILYNYIMQEEIFNMGSSGKFLHCGFNDQSIIRKAGIDDMKSYGICVPYDYDVAKVKDRMEQFQIYVDQKLHWSKLFTTTCNRVVDLAKSEAKSFTSLL